MPLVRIDVPAGNSADYLGAMSAVVYRALVETLNVPEHDNFQVITEHAPGRLVIDPGYLGITRTDAAVIIQVTLNAGRSTVLKQAFYRAVADGLHEHAGIRREDVVIGLIEVAKENWSFGNGEAQYA